MVLKGFKLGILLQLAVGPVCVFVLQTAWLHGFWTGLTAVWGVVLIDGAYIVAAIWGMSTLAGRINRWQRAFKLGGSVILLVFGLNMMLGAVGMDFLPILGLGGEFSGGRSAFLPALLLTGSNPLTILFWAGLFASKLAEAHLSPRHIRQFGLGALLATAVFLSLVCLAGSMLGSMVFTPVVIKLLNLAVGLLFIYFALRLLWK